MTLVVFEFHIGLLPVDMSPARLIRAMQESMYPGQHDDIIRSELNVAEAYFDTQAWDFIFALGREHTEPFTYYNGVVTTWSSYSSIQLISIVRSGNQSNRPYMATA